MTTDQLTKDLVVVVKNAIDLIRKLEREKHEAVLAEREACAKVCETEGERIDASWKSCAAAIRAKGQA